MPNWCFNSLAIKGEKGQVNQFKRKAKDKGTALSLAKLFPEPDYNRVRVKPTYPHINKKFSKKKEEEYVKPSEAWWDWRVQNWGTKWDVEADIDTEKEFKNGNKVIFYAFDSAWSPPIGWLKKVASDFPLLSFTLRYSEPGEGFKGTFVAELGQVVKDDYIE